MFYSQIILAKKGPLGQVWQAAHWGERKLGRPAVFSTDIAAVTTSIANPTVPMALRVSGHLLLGIVRIYSRKVQFLLDDCHQAMIKVKMAYSSNSNDVNSGGPVIDIALTTRTSGAAAASSTSKGLNTSGNALNISNFGEYNDIADVPTNINSKTNDGMDADYFLTTTHFAIPLDELLQRASDVQGMEHTEDDWVPAELDDSALHLSNNLLSSATTTAAGTGLHSPSEQHFNQAAEEEEWGVFNPNDDEDEEPKGDDDDSIPPTKQDDGSATQMSDIEVTRAVNDSGTSDVVSR
jgi:cohesin complex subunit SCC1